MNILIALGIPFIGTTLGAAMVFFMKEKIAPKLEKALLGFASGVMIAASVWSLLIPSIDMTEAQGGIAWVPAVVGFLLGIAFLLLLDTLIPHLHLNSDAKCIDCGGIYDERTWLTVEAAWIYDDDDGNSCS